MRSIDWTLLHHITVHNRDIFQISKKNPAAREYVTIGYLQSRIAMIVKEWNIWSTYLPV